MEMKNKQLIRITSAIFAASLLITGCSSTQEKESVDANVPLSGTDEQIFIGDTIEMNYDPNVIMKRAEAYHEKGGFAEAVVEHTLAAPDPAEIKAHHRKSMGNEGRKNVINKFNIEKMCFSTYSEYKKLIN